MSTTSRQATTRSPIAALSAILALVLALAGGLLGTSGRAAAAPGTGTPFGHFDTAVAVPSGIEVSGWAIDPDTTNPIYVWVTLDGVGRHMYANEIRPDVAAAYPRAGPNHGFFGVLPASQGTHRVCVTASNVGPGVHMSLGCRTVTVSGTPTGNFEAVRGVVGGVEVTGWAIDPDVTDSIYVWVTIDGIGDHIRARGPRPDVGAAFPRYGADHGFSGSLPAAPGNHTVCVTASNVGPGAHRLLGCRNATSPAVDIAVDAGGRITMPTSLEPRGHAFRVTSAQDAMVTLVEPLNGYTKAQFAADLGPQDSPADDIAAEARLKANTRWFGGVVSFAGTPSAFGVNLDAGSYWVADLQQPPLEADVLTLTVAGTAQTTVWPLANARATSDDSHPWLLPPTLTRRGTLQVSNSSAEVRRLVLAVKPGNLTLAQWLGLLATGAGFEGHALPGTSFASGDVELYWMYDLQPGQYAVLVQPLADPWDGPGAVGVTIE